MPVEDARRMRRCEEPEGVLRLRLRLRLRGVCLILCVCVCTRALLRVMITMNKIVREPR